MSGCDTHAHTHTDANWVSERECVLVYGNECTNQMMRTVTPECVVCVSFLQDWRAKAGRCAGGRPWSRWRLMSGGFASSSCCKAVKEQGCGLAAKGGNTGKRIVRITTRHVRPTFISCDFRHRSIFLVKCLFSEYIAECVSAEIHRNQRVLKSLLINLWSDSESFTKTISPK